jgi:hypothetical protein
VSPAVAISHHFIRHLDRNTKEKPTHGAEESSGSTWFRLEMISGDIS